MPNELQPTYVPFLDKLLGGGTAPRGVYGVLGPTGIGKTHLANMIACNGATNGSVFREACVHAGPWVIFDLESHPSISKKRILSHCAMVPREHTFAEKTVEQPYELQRRAELTKLAGTSTNEAKRLKHASGVLKHKLLLRNGEHLRELNALTGDASGCSMDVTDVISQCINVASSKQHLGGIVIDGVSNVWNLARDSTRMTERNFIQNFARVFCRDLAENHHCPVWVTHQVNGTACDASPLAQLSHGNAARCKGFADSLDACFVLGTSPENEWGQGKRFAIQCTKGNPEFAKLERLVLTHDQNFASLVEVANAIESKCRQTWVVANDKVGSSNLEELHYIDGLLERLP